MDLFQLLGVISIKNADAIEALNETSQAGQKTQSKLSKALGAIGKGAVAVGKTIGTGLVAGGAAMGALTVKALNLSGELEQNMGGSEQVFAEYAGKMQETAKTAFENMGLSTSDFLATANKMGALFQGAGFSIEESSSIASDAMQRAADVASIMGIDTASAMEAIAGAAKGNFTMMDNLGVAMNDTTLQAYAMSKGIDKATKDMTNQEKIGLAMEMFMEKTSYAAGNYARENETLAGSLGTAKAALTNFLDGSGDVDSLVSAFSNAAKVIVNNIKEIAPRLVSGLTDIINQIIPMLPPLLQELLPVIIEGAVSLINGLVAALPTVIDALMNALPALIQGVTQIINALIQALPTIMQSLVSALPTLIPILVNALVSMIVMLCSHFGEIIQPIIDNLPMIVMTLVSALMDNLPVLIQAAITLVLEFLTALWNGIKNVFAPVVEWFGQIFNSVKDKIVEFFSPVLEFFQNVWNKICEIFAPVVDFFKVIFENAWIAIKAVWSVVAKFFEIIWALIRVVFEPVVKWFKNIFSKAWEGIKAIWNNVTGFFSNIWAKVKNVFSPVVNFFKDAFGKAWSAIKNIFSNVGSFFGNLWNTIKDKFSAIGTKISESISGAVKGAINGVIGQAEKIINGFFGMINGAINMINEIPGVNISKIKLVEFARLAKGGVVDKPTPAVFGEDGAEAVVPLENNTGWLNKVAWKLHEFTKQYKGGLDNSFSIRSVELQQMQVSELQTLNITANKILEAILAMDESMGGHLREALDGVSFSMNKREFARLVKEVI